MEDELFQLWPTSILKKKFEKHASCKRDLLEFIKFYKKKYPSGRKANENKNLYESNYDITNFAQRNKSLYNLIKFIGEGFKIVAYDKDIKLISSLKKRKLPFFEKNLKKKFKKQKYLFYK